MVLLHYIRLTLHVAIVTFRSSHSVIVFSKDIGECESNPCENDGVCIDRVNGFTCNCTAGWTGLTCNKGKTICLKYIIWLDLHFSKL